MQIRNLTPADTENLLLAFNGAFADYLVPLQLTKELLQSKMNAESVLPEWSVGVFDQEKMIAFIIHGVRTINGKKTVYNAGTGVLPEYRGQGLVGKMYKHILPFLKENKVEELVLEVIENNKPAIRAYEKNGFSVKRKFLCFAGESQTEACSNPADIKPLADINWETLQSFWDILPGWQSANQSMELMKPTALGAFINNELAGYVLFNPANSRIYQLAVSPAHRRKGIASQLFAEMRRQLPKGKIAMNNIDEAAESLKLFLEKQGLVNFINQFEMTKDL